jgi:hypothetical protein
MFFLPVQGRIHRLGVKVDDCLGDVGTVVGGLAVNAPSALATSEKVIDVCWKIMQWLFPHWHFGSAFKVYFDL